MQKWLIGLATLALLGGCAAAPASPPEKEASVPASTATPDWPRTVQDAEGKSLLIKEKPQRIHTLSVGYDEISLYLVGPGRLAAVGTATANPLCWRGCMARTATSTPWRAAFPAPPGSTPGSRGWVTDRPSPMG